MFLSRGSEVYVIGPRGPRLLERRQATVAEEDASSRPPPRRCATSWCGAVSTSRSSTTVSTVARSI